MLPATTRLLSTKLPNGARSKSRAKLTNCGTAGQSTGSPNSVSASVCNESETMYARGSRVAALTSARTV